MTALIVAVVLAAPIAMGTIAALVVFAAGALACRRGDGIEALIDATREETPDYVPAEWTEEYNQ